MLKVGDRYKNDISLLQGLSANCQKKAFKKLKKQILCILELKLRTFTQFSGSLVDNYIVCAAEITVNVLILNLFADTLDILCVFSLFLSPTRIIFLHLFFKKSCLPLHPIHSYPSR